ncbi:MAG: Cna B-type domain-containing protein, partial [Anaerovoracaceae bacterium]
NIQSSTRLEDFLQAITFDGVQQNADGTYSAVKGETYKVHMKFAETPNGLQFSDSETLTYKLPNGFKPVAKSDGKFTVNVSTGDGNFAVTGNTYSLDEEGNIRVDWNQNDPNFAQLTACGDTEFTLDFEGEFDENSKEIKFSDGTTATVDKDADVDVWKNVEEKNGRYYYTVTVRGSKGVNKDVSVTDALADNSLLNIDTSTLQVTTYPQGLQYNKEYAYYRGFKYTIPELKKNETVTFTYYADLTGQENLSANDVRSRTRNTAKATSGKHEHEASQDLAYIINKEMLEKTHTVNQTSDKYIINWRIDYDRGNYVDPSGVTLTDRLDYYSGSTYEGNGITVYVYDKYGNDVERRDVAWKDLNKDYYGWKYTIPEGDRTGYRYIITYQTSFKKSDIHTEISQKNSISDGSRSKDDSADLKPGINESIGVKKEATKVTYKEAEWKVTLTVPAGGLDSAYITEYLPSTWLHNKRVADEIIDPNGGDLADAFTVDGLKGDEYYTAELKRLSDNSPYVDIRFHKNKDGENGLLASDNGQKRTITFKTKNNTDWVKESESNTWYLDHRNGVYFSTDGQSVYDEDTVKPTKIDVTKNWDSSAQIYYQPGDNATEWDRLPIYRFNVFVSGMKDIDSETGDLVLDDYFDTSKFKYTEYGSKWNQDNKVNQLWYEGTVCGSDDSASSFNVLCTGTVQETDYGFRFTAPKSKITKKDGSYYNYYQIRYYLMVKDADAYKALYKEGLNDSSGKVTMTNKVKFADVEDSADSTYDTNVLDKKVSRDNYEENGDHYADFEIDFNPKSMDLDPNSDTLNLTDEATNLQIDPKSIQVVQGSGAVLNCRKDGTGIVGTVPDKQHIVIKYRARIMGSGNVTYSNNVTVFNYKDGSSSNVWVGSNGSGSGTNPNVTLVKTKEGSVEGLAGAKFKLISPDGSYLKDESGNDKIFTTGSDGSVAIQENMGKYGWVLEKGKTYTLKEVEAPDGYKKAADKKFIITTSWNDKSPDTYFNHTNVVISDEINSAEINVSKKVVGDSADQSRSFDFKLNAKDKNSMGLNVACDAVVTKPSGDTVASKILFRNGEAHFSIRGGEKISIKVPDGTSYNVTETSTGDFDKSSVNTSGTALSDTDNAPAAEFTNTMKTSVRGKKTWVGVNSKNAPDATIDLLRNGKKFKSVTLKNGKSEYEFTGLPKFDENGNAYSYTVQEEPLTGYTSSQNGFNFTNTKKDDKVSISGTKTWVAPEGTTVPDVTIDLYRDGKKTDQKAVIKSGK